MANHTPRKTILITGASSGIGKATALAAAAAGWQVYACGRDQQRLDNLAQQSANITTLAFDLTDRASCQLVLGKLNVDVVLLNAGTCEYIDVEHWETEAFKRVFDANFFSVVYCVEALLPNLTAGKQLLMVDSLARLLPFTRSQAYGASKAALFYLAQSLAVDLDSRGVIVKTLSPGFVATPLTAKNTFAMPMQITAEQAAQAILSSIDRRGTTFYFPLLFSGILRLLALLPLSWQRSLCKRLRQGDI
ncbi:SDR family NAD(P)-dependent oxidoreductase [Vibrio cholerae]|nr:SDR family NAD(P)-dependent oxidoreductase [Vibrio cholerae]EJB8378477.1 SDR family NAD(P)-dependent oxidoreductase [Vibrio cholerae]